MDSTIVKRRALALSSALPLALLLLVSAPPVPGAGQDLDVDVDVQLLPLAQLPVAVARVEDVGVPRSDLERLVSTLFTAGVPPAEILETIRFLPAVQRDEVVFGIDDDDFRRNVEGEEARGSRGMGSYVQALQRRGLRGRELATAIHRELNRRGIPAGGAAAGRASRGVESRGVLERGFLFGADDAAPAARARGRDIPPGAGSRRGAPARGRQGPPADRGQGPPADRGGPPDDRGGPPDRGQGPPADRGGPPDAGGGPPDDRGGGPPDGRGGGPPDGRGGPPDGRGGPPADLPTLEQGGGR